MIPVRMAEEPPAFNRDVRQKGLAAIGELVGRGPFPPRRGRKRTPIAAREQDIPADRFPPYWRDALGLLLAAGAGDTRRLALRAAGGVASVAAAIVAVF